MSTAQLDLLAPDQALAAITIKGKRKGKRKPKINRAGNEYVAQGFDACQTPAYALDPILPYLRSDWVIWESARGEGFIVNAIQRRVKSVISSDILTGQNFFQYEPSESWNCMVTNPPYTLKYGWLRRCYSLGMPFALLLPVETLGAKKAQALFQVYGVEVIFMNKRINFKMPIQGWDGSGAQFPTCWITWGLGIGQQMTFYDFEHANQPSLFSV